MPDYKAMYYHLFNAMTDAIELLQNAQLETEEMVLSEENPETILFVSEDSSNLSEEAKE